MYGNVGLPTAKGSGTSGYVQKSLAFIGWKKYDSSNYKEVIQKFRENPVPLKRKANVEILEHEKLHKIESQLFDFAEELQNEGKLNEKEIEEKINLKRKELLSEYENNNNKISNIKETHQLSKLKEEQIYKVKKALGVNNEYVPGSAFDFEAQQEQKQIRLLEKKKNKKLKIKEKEHKAKHKHRKDKEIEKNNEKERSYYSRSRSRSRNRNAIKHKSKNKSRSRSISKSLSNSQSYSSKS